MDVEIEKWIGQLTAKLEPHMVFVSTNGKIAAYVWNRKKKHLMFITQKEADKLTRKGIAWKRLGEDW